MFPLNFTKGVIYGLQMQMVSLDAAQLVVPERFILGIYYLVLLGGCLRALYRLFDDRLADALGRRVLGIFPLFYRQCAEHYARFLDRSQDLKSLAQN